MEDPRVVTDALVSAHFKDHPHIRYSDIHDDFPIAYIFGIQYQFSYDELPNDQEVIRQINAEYEHLRKVTLYRQHRGGLDDSMATVTKVHSLEELRKHILEVDDWAPPSGKLSVEKYGKNELDTRIGWNTHIVMWNQSVMGFTNGPLK